MPAWGWVLIAVAGVALVALIVMRMMAKRKTNRLQEQFGPEYDRTIEGSKNRRQAESQLAARAERREQLDIRPPASGTRRSGRRSRRSSSTARRLQSRPATR